MKITEYLKLSLVELEPDKKMDFRTWLGIFAGAGSNNLQKIDDSAKEINNTITIIKNSPSTVFIDAKKKTVGIYVATVPSITPEATDLILNGIYILKLDTANETTSVSVRINDTIGKTLKKLNTTGVLVDLDIGDIQAEQEHIFKYNGQFLVLINTDALTFMNKQIDDFVLKQEVVDSLESDKSDVPLSAKQGKNLDTKILETAVTINTKVDDIKTATDKIIEDNKIEINEKVDNIKADTDTVIAENKAEIEADVAVHVNDKENPHEITKAQVGLPKAEDTSDIEKNVLSASKLTTSRNINGVLFDGTADIVVADDTKIPLSQKGVAGGVAPLDESGVIESTFLPSFVNDVIEFELKSEMPTVGEQGKIYIVYGDTKENNGTYRWSGTLYVLISNPLEYATSEDAITGTENTKIMTPLRVKESVDNAINTVNTTISAIDTRVTAISTAIADTDVRVTANSTAITNINTDITGIKSTDTAQDVKIAQNSEDIAHAEAELIKKANPSSEIQVTLLSSGWTGSDAPYTQILTVNGITATNNAHWDAAMSATKEQLENAGACFIKATAQAVNSITFTAYDDKPTVNIPISVVILG